MAIGGLENGDSDQNNGLSQANVPLLAAQQLNSKNISLVTSFGDSVTSLLEDQKGPSRLLEKQTVTNSEGLSIVQNERVKDKDESSEESAGSIHEAHLAVGESAAAHSFDLVFVLPMPSTATQEDDEKFKTKFMPTDGVLKYAHSYQDIIRHCIVSPALRKSAEICTLDTLSDARNCIIELLQSFCETLGASLHGGAEIYKFASEDGEQLFICIKVSEHLAESLAEVGEYPLQLGLECLESDLHIKITDTSRVIPAFMGFNSEVKHLHDMKTYADVHTTDKTSILRAVDKIRLLYDKITDYIDLNELERLGFLHSVFPDHNKATLLPLRQKWANMCYLLFPGQPIDEIRDYFGEDVAFYFLLVGFLAKGVGCLMPMAFACSIIWHMGYPDVGQLIFCVLLVIWSTVLNKLWRRHESYYTNLWGMDRVKFSNVKTPLNPDFHEHKTPSPLDENLKILQPDKWKRMYGCTISLAVSFAFTLLAICGVILNRNWISAVDKEQGPDSWASEGGAILLSLQMQFFDKIWDKLLVGWLNNLEQHVTQYQADQSRMAKTFVIKFLNAFFPFIYLAYVQPSVDPAGCQGDCRAYLRENLMIVFITYITFGLYDIAFPLLSLRWSVYQEAKKAKASGHDVFKQSLLEEQVLMAAYTGQDQRDDYLSVVFPVAYVMMFGTMLPSMAFLAFFSLTSQIRTHAWKLCGATRRTFPTRAEGIGLWDSILSLISYLAIFNCIALLVSQVEGIGARVPGFATLTEALGIEDNSQVAKVLLFFVLENIAVLFKLTIDMTIDNVTAATKLEMARQELQRTRVFNKVHSEFHEDIVIKCPGDVEARKAIDQLEPLRPGHELYVEPFI